MKLAQAEAKLTRIYRQYFLALRSQENALKRMDELECRVADLGGDIAGCIRTARQSYNQENQT